MSDSDTQTRLLTGVAPVALSLTVMGLVAGLAWGIKLESRNDRLESRFDSISERNTEQDRRLTSVETRFDNMANRVLLLEERQRVVLEQLRVLGRPIQPPFPPP